MSHGFLAFNANNQILISSDTRNLHLVGKPGLYQISNQVNRYGGCRLFTYRISSSVPVVPFFTMPTQDRYGVTAIRLVGANLWEIELLRSGTSDTPPEMYVFADPGAATSVETHGMLVLKDDGLPSFDSRFSPLAITGGLNVSSPSTPRTAAIPYQDPKYCNTNDEGAFTPDNSLLFSVAAMPAKPIFSFSSLSQAQLQADYGTSEEECDGIGAYGECVGARRVYSWVSRYWCFYRSGILRESNTSLRCGWIATTFGCNWEYKRDSQFLGIGTDGSSGSAGSWPYSNETINRSSVPVIIADGSRYD